MGIGGIFSNFLISVRHTAAAFFLAVFFLLSNTLSVQALSSGGIGGYPAHADPGIQYSDSWFIYNLDLGESKEDSILLTNHSDTAEKLKIYAVDSVATGDGNFSLKAETDPRTGVGLWIHLNESVITLGPGEERELPFTIMIPENVDVGEHSGGIILEKTQLGTTAIGQNSASIVTRVGIRIYETVPGELIRKVEPADFTVVRQTPKDKKPLYRIQLSALNKSNVSLKAHANVHITGWGRTKYFPKSHFKDGFYFDYTDLYSSFGGETLTGDWQLLRDQKVSTSWEWPEPAFGHFVFQADITYEGTNGPETFSTDRVEITIIPWALIFWIILLVAILLGYFIFRKKQLSGKGWQKYTVRTGEQLTDIAVNTGIGWKKLAAVNKIKAPYLVKTGQMLLVPRMLTTTPPKVEELISQPIVTTPVVPEKNITQVITQKKVTLKKVASPVADQTSAMKASRKPTKRVPRKKKPSVTSTKL